MVDLDKVESPVHKFELMIKENHQLMLLLHQIQLDYVSSPIIRPLKNRENKLKSLNLMTDEKIKIYRNADRGHTQAV